MKHVEIIGLKNKRKCCFANATLQILSGSKLIRSYISEFYIYFPENSLFRKLGLFVETQKQMYADEIVVHVLKNSTMRHMEEQDCRVFFELLLSILDLEFQGVYEKNSFKKEKHSELIQKYMKERYRIAIASEWEKILKKHIYEYKNICCKKLESLYEKIFSIVYFGKTLYNENQNILEYLEVKKSESEEEWSDITIDGYELRLLCWIVSLVVLDKKEEDLSLMSKILNIKKAVIADDSNRKVFSIKSKEILKKLQDMSQISGLSETFVEKPRYFFRSWSIEIISCKNCRHIYSAENEMVFGIEAENIFGSEIPIEGFPCEICKKFQMRAKAIVLGSFGCLFVHNNTRRSLPVKNKLMFRKKRYVLNGAILYDGNGQNGHYRTVSRRKGMFFLIDDANIEPIDIEDGIKDWYMLSYEEVI